MKSYFAKATQDRAITASAAGKLMLTGSYAVVHGQPAIVTAVDQRLYVTINENKTDELVLHAPDLGLENYAKKLKDLGKGELPKAVRFIEILYKNFLESYPQDHGINITTKSDFSSSFGFGSSSAVTVAFARALLELYQIKKANKELFDICYKAVIEVQGVGSGFDIASAIWGGTIKYVTPAKVVEPVAIENLDLVVAYTGIKADTPTLIRMVDKQLDEYPQKINKIFKQIGAISDRLALALEENKLEIAGALCSKHHELVKTLGVSSDKLDALVVASIKAGAYGASLSGAGGGDCMFAVVGDNNKKQVEKALVAAGGEIMKVKLNSEGVKVER